MPTLIGTLAWRALLCAAVSAMAWYFIGPTALAMTAPLFGVALAKPLLELASATRHAIRARALNSIEGNHYEFRGMHVRVIEDEAHCRWVRGSDVRRIIGSSDTEHALLLTYGDGYRVLGRPAEGYFSEAALLEHLARQNDARAGRLRLWAERVVVGPARERRRRLGLAGEKGAA